MVSVWWNQRPSLSRDIASDFRSPGCGLGTGLCCTTSLVCTAISSGSSACQFSWHRYSYLCSLPPAFLLLFSCLVSSQSSYFLVLRSMQVYGCIVSIWYAVVCLQAWLYVSLRAMPWYVVLTLSAVVGLLVCWSRSAGFWGSLLCPVNVPGVS